MRNFRDKVQFTPDSLKKIHEMSSWQIFNGFYTIIRKSKWNEYAGAVLRASYNHLIKN